MLKNSVKLLHCQFSVLIFYYSGRNKYILMQGVIVSFIGNLSCRYKSVRTYSLCSTVQMAAIFGYVLVVRGSVMLAARIRKKWEMQLEGLCCRLLICKIDNLRLLLLYSAVSFGICFRLGRFSSPSVIIAFKAMMILQSNSVWNT